MEFKKPITKRMPNSKLICFICGDIARGMNFDVITCMSCKAFFRRHALRSTKSLRCLLNNECTITKQTRGGCSACRLKKCFSFGMNPNLIRSPYKVKRNKENIPEIKPLTLSLLNQDRSLLTVDEWNLLSNIIHAYDEQNLVIRTQWCFKEQSSLPPKIRSKQSNTLELIGSYYSAIQPFIERSSYFHALPTTIRRVIIKNNLNGTGAFNSIIAAVDANSFDNESHIAACNELYGADYVQESYRFSSRLESNRTLLKVLLMILTFSTNCSIVIYDSRINTINLSSKNSTYLVQIQNIFITMLWKYLVYQYGYIDAIKHYVHMIKNYLDLLNRVNENLSRQHHQMVDTIVEKTIHVLQLHN